jgi:hypothetical protein
MSKLNIPKSKQIQGLRKAIANRKTPRQFIPSLKKRLAKLTSAAMVLFILYGCSAIRLLAQTPVIIQPTQQTLATNIACTGTAQTFAVNNRNQTQHFATSSANASVTSFQMIIQGVDLSGNVFQISDIGQIGGAVSASGYFPNVQIQVTCLPATTGTFSVSYSASSATSPVNAGAFLNSQIDKLVFRGLNAQAPQTTTLITTPFGSSSGKLLFNFSANPGAVNASISVQCQGSVTLGTYDTFSFSLQNGVPTIQQFDVPAEECPAVVIGYSSNASFAGTMNLEYIFNLPGMQPSITQLGGCLIPGGSGFTGNLTPISVGANTTQKLTSNGANLRIMVCGVAVSVGVAGTIQFTEGTGATCGTGSSNVSGAMTLAVGTPLTLGAATPIFATGIAGDGLCITTAGGATAAGWISYQYLPI